MYCRRRIRASSPPVIFHLHVGLHSLEKLDLSCKVQCLCNAVPVGRSADQPDLPDQQEEAECKGYEMEW